MRKATQSSKNKKKPRIFTPRPKGKPTRDDGKCGAKLRNKDKTCRNPAGKKTEHLGFGRCWLHEGRPPRTGLYSTVVQEQYREVYHEMLGQKEALASVNDEIAFLRICAMRLAQGAEDILDPKQMQKVHECGLTLGVLDSHAERTEGLAEVLERITKAVERKGKIEQGIAIRLTPMQISQFIDTFKSIVTRHITDTKIIAAIGRDIAVAYAGLSPGEGAAGH